MQNTLTKRVHLTQLTTVKSYLEINETLKTSYYRRVRD